MINNKAEYYNYVSELAFNIQEELKESPGVDIEELISNTAEAEICWYDTLYEVLRYSNNIDSAPNNCGALQGNGQEILNTIAYFALVDDIREELKL